LCFGDSLKITVKGAQHYDWYVNNNLIKSGTDTIISSGAITSKRSYKVIGTDSNFCKNTDSIKVLVNALPLKPQLYAEKARFYSSYPLRNQWYLNQVKIDSAINQYFYPPVYGLYQVEYTDLKGCKSMSESYEYKYVSIAEVSSVLGVKAYPNPFDEQLQINNGNTETLRCEVLSSDGKQIVAVLSIAPGQTSIDTHDWSSGIYVLVMYHQGIRQVVRLSKM
jgi:hypothetical protein